MPSEPGGFIITVRSSDLEIVSVVFQLFIPIFCQLHPGFNAFWVASDSCVQLGQFIYLIYRNHVMLQPSQVDLFHMLRPIVKSNLHILQCQSE